MSGQNKITDSTAQNFISGGNAWLPLPDRARFALWQASTNPPDQSSQWETLFDKLTTGDGGALELGYFAPTSVHGPLYEVAVQGGGAGHNHRGYWGQSFMAPQNTIKCKGIIWIAYDINAAQSNHYVGLSNQHDITDPLTGDCAMIGIQKAANLVPGNFFFFVGVGGVVTTVDTKIPNDQNRHQFDITISNGRANLIIDGALVCSVTTNLPTAPLNLTWYLLGNDTGAGGTTVAIMEYLYGEQSTP